MEKCKCYEVRTEELRTTSLPYDPPYKHKYGVCLGTKEVDRCSCGGDEFKCDFYESVRKKAGKKMNTAQMWLKAQENGKTYRSNDLFYNKKHGFVDSNFNPWPINCISFIDDIFSWIDWRECVPPYMTKAEAEKEFGIKIVG